MPNNTIACINNSISRLLPLQNRRVLRYLLVIFFRLPPAKFIFLIYPSFADVAGKSQLSRQQKT
jgi:hypothetical protein